MEEDEAQLQEDEIDEVIEGEAVNQAAYEAQPEDDNFPTREAEEIDENEHEEREISPEEGLEEVQNEYVAEIMENDGQMEGMEMAEGEEAEIGAEDDANEPVDAEIQITQPQLFNELEEDLEPLEDLDGLPPLPLPYIVSDEGQKMPLPGVESLFLTGTTVELIGISGLSKADGKLMATVPKEKLLSDIQFRGAISDFQVIKAKIVESMCDQITIRVNEDDTYGDGNNYEIALSKEAVETWQHIAEEAERRRVLAERHAARAKFEAMKPKSKKVHVPKPWISLGSEMDIEEASVRARREPVKVVLTRPRKDFGSAPKLSDKDAHELWNSSQMECRPFKDPNFDFRKMLQDMGVQGVTGSAEVGVQVAGGRPRPQACQYQARDLDTDEKDSLIASNPMLEFLERSRDLCEEALVQNEITNIFQDDFLALAEEDGGGGNRKEAVVSEMQSFMHLTYSKNKVVSAIQWLPHRKGAVAVACTEALTHAERVAKAGRPCNAYVLIWNFKDPILPEYVLQSPFEVFSFQYNPVNPELIAAGCYNGQVVIWDTSNEHERISRMKNSTKEDGNDEATVAVVKYKYSTSIDHSHQAVVTDLRWLPGLDISNRGKVTKPQDSQRECNFFATVSSDGKVNFWDIRVERLMKKGRRADDSLDLVWRPTHVVHLLSLAGVDLGGIKFCFNTKQLDAGVMYVGSYDGELVHASFVKPDGEENPDYTKSCIAAHVGPIIALERSPFFDDCILTVGDWTFQLWKEGQSSPVFQSGFNSEYYSAGCWSPSRPAVIYLTDHSGSLEIWDMLDRSHEPSMRVTLASSPIMSMAFTAGGPGTGPTNTTGLTQGAMEKAAQQYQYLAIGDSAGVLRILELPRNLRRQVPNERKLMAAFLEREQDRVADVASRIPMRVATAKSMKEAEEQRKAAEDMAAAEAAAQKDLVSNKDQTMSVGNTLTTTVKPSGLDKTSRGGANEAMDDLQDFGLDEKVEAEYLRLERKFKIDLGLIVESTDR